MATEDPAVPVFIGRPRISIVRSVESHLCDDGRYPPEAWIYVVSAQIRSENPVLPVQRVDFPVGPVSDFHLYEVVQFARGERTW